MDDSWPVQLPLQSAIQSSETLRLQQQSPHAQPFVSRTAHRAGPLRKWLQKGLGSLPGAS
jgi:hypothetical protein